MDTASHQSPESRLHFLDYWRIIRVRKLVILLVFLLVVTTTTVVTFWLPKTYASTARIQVERDKSDSSMRENDISVSPDYIFIQNQFERIRSQTILDTVITNLALHERWAKRYGRPAPYSIHDTVELLRERMDLKQLRNTSLIDIKVFNEVPEEAAEVANKVAEVYKAHREDRFGDTASSGLDVVQMKLDEQSQEVTNLAARVDTLRKELGITDVMDVNDVYVKSISPEDLMKRQSDVSSAEAQWYDANNKFKTVDGKSPQELRLNIGTINPDAYLPSLLLQLAQAEQFLASKRAELTDEHPEVQRVKAEYDKVEKQVDDAVAGIVTGLRDKRDSAKATFDNLKESFEAARKRDNEMASKSRPYFEEKQKLISARQALETLTRTAMLRSVDIKMPTKYLVEITDRAVADEKPVSPRVVLNIALSVIVGLIAGIGLAFFIEYLDTSVKTIDDIEQILQTPVLTVIPQGVTSLIEEGLESPNAEAYRVLRTNIIFQRKNPTQNVLTAVSGGAAEGKSTTLLNLAIILAQNGSRVLLVDTDLRRPSLHKTLNTSNSIGVTSYLLKQHTLEEAIQTTPVEGLHFLPSGKLPSSSLGILNSPHFHEFVQEMKRRYDFVLLDAPPVLGVSDASIILREADITLLVLQHRKYPQAMNVRAKQTIDKFGGNLLGVVLNNINLSTDSYYYYYSGFGYGYTNQNQGGDDKPNGTHKPAAAEGDKVALKRKY